MKLNLYFVENAKLGKNNWWRYMFSIVLIMAFYLLGIFITGQVGIYLNNGKPPKPMTEFIIQHSNIFVSKIATNLEFIVGFIGLLLAVKFFHKRNPITLFTTFSSIKWKRIVFGAIVYSAIYLAIEIIYSYYNGNSFNINLPTYKFYSLLIISLAIVPIQTTFEESFHRGYLLQTLTYYFKYPWIALLITSFLFGVIHIDNPEYLIFYCLTGLFLGLIIILSNSLELAIGIHSAHNLMGLILSDNSTENSLFYHKENQENIFIWLFPIIITFILVLNKYGSRNLKILFMKIGKNT